VRQSGRLSEIPLAPLNADETATLATQIAALDCDPSFLGDLYNTTRGNPLFVVESVRASQEDRASSNVPPRVQAVIGARFAQLSSAAYELAGFAAIIGRPFSFELLAKATDWDEDSLSRALEELWQRRIIDGQGAISFNFTHDLLREVAHAELSPIRRRSMHKRVARALEEVPAADLTGVSGRLAAHYDAAGMAEQAIRFYLVAASVARQRFADNESADLLRRALRLCREFPETANRDERELDLLVTLGPSLVTTHGYSKPEVGETYERGLNLSTRSGNRRHLFALRSGLWLYSLVRGEIERSRRLAQDCVDGARSDRNQAQEMAGYFLLGTSLFHLGRLAESWDRIEVAGSFSHNSSDPALALFAGPDVGVFCRIYAAQLLCQFGQVESAIAKNEEAIVRARELSHPFTLGIVMVYSAMLNIYRGESELTLARAEEASEICTKHGFEYYLALAEIFAGWAMAVEGKTAAGLARLRHGLDLLRATGAELRLPFYYALLAEALRLGGQIGEAMASVASGFAFLSKNGEMWSAAQLHRVQGDLLQHRADTSQARISYQRAIEVARQTGASLFEMKAADRLSQL
jgi:predicted ATPase